MTQPNLTPEQAGKALAAANKLVQASVAYLAAKTETRGIASHMARYTTGSGPTYDPNLKTACTDGQSIRVGPWVCNLPTRQLAFVLAHEIMHCVYQHPLRNRLYRKLGIGPDLKPINHKRMNTAEDFNINATLLSDLGFRPQDMPPGGLFDSQYGPEMTADEIYCQLPEDAGEDEGEESGNSFDEHEDAPEDEGDGDPEPKTPQDIADIAGEATKQALLEMQAIGALPGSMRRRLSQAYEPRIPWTDKLRDRMENVAAGAEQNSPRANRRRLVLPPHPYFPSQRGYALGTVVIAPDVSGSISQREFNIFMAELKSILTMCQPEHLHMVSWDSDAVHHEIEDEDDLERVEVHGGGGTEYRAAIDLIENMDLEPDLVICMTDGFVDWGNTARIRWPHITLSTSTETCPVGETIHVDIY